MSGISKIISSLTIAEATSAALRVNESSDLLTYAGQVVSGMYLEIAFLVFFVLGLGFLRMDKMITSRKTNKAKLMPKLKMIRSHYHGGEFSQVVKVWRQIENMKYDACAPLDVMRLVVRSIIETEPRPALALGSMMKYIGAFPNASKAMISSEKPERMARPRSLQAGNTMIMNQMLRVVLKASPSKFADLSHAIQLGLGANADEDTLEILVAGYAGIGDERRVNEAMNVMRSQYRVVSPRAYAAAVEGFMHCGKMECVKSTLAEMQKIGCTLSGKLVVDIMKLAGSEKMEFFKLILAQKDGLLHTDALAIMLNEESMTAKECEALCHERSLAKSFLYSEALTRSYAKSGDVLAVAAFDAMKSEFTIADNIYVSLLCTSAESHSVHFAEHVFNVRKAAGGEIHLSLFSAMMKVYSFAKRFDEACDLYPLIKESGITMDEKMIGCLLTFASRAGRTDLVEALGGLTGGSAQHHIARIRACRMSRDFKTASTILNEMRSLGCLDAAACNSVIDVYVAAGRTEDALQLLKESKKESIFENEEAEVVGYNTVLKGFCNINQMHVARSLIEEMRVANLTPNAVSFNCMLNCLVTNRSYSEAWALYVEMQAMDVKGDSYTTSTLVKGLKNCNDENYCRDVLDLMDNTEVDANQDEVLFIVLLDVFSKRRDTRRLKRILETVKGRNISPSIVTVNTMLKSFSQLKMIDEAKALWEDMIVERGMLPTEISIGCMVDALSTNGKVHEAVELVKSMNHRVSMNTIIYSTLIKGFAIARDATGAHEAFNLMKDEGCTPNLITINTLIDAYSRGGRMDLCADLLEKMQGMDIKPDRITFSTVIKGFCLRGDLEQAMAVLEPMKRQGFSPDLTVYNTLIDGCAGNDHYSLCDKIFAQMQKDKVAPSNYTLTVLIKRYGREGKVDAAFNFFDKASKEYNLKPTVHALTCLISVCVLNKQLPRALQVLERMEAQGPAPDAMTYGKVVNACIRANTPEKAVNFVLNAFGVSGRGQRVGIDQDLLLNLVDQLDKKRLMDSHAIPLVQKLRAANVPLPQRLVSATLRGAVNEKNASAPWRNRK